MCPTTIYTWQRDHYTVSTDPDLLDLNVVHGYLRHSYWSPGVPHDVVARAVQHSLCFGLYVNQDQSRRQIGFGRLVTDQATFAYFADVFVLERFRGSGLGVWLVDCMLQCPALDGIRTFLLATLDAHSLYEKFGFETLPDTGKMMVMRRDMPWYRPELAGE